MSAFRPCLTWRASYVIAACAVGATACTPTLDWRMVRPEGSAISLLLPCKPQVQARNVPLAGKPVRLTLQACSAAGSTWALAFADVADPAQVGPALRALQAAARANLGAAAVPPQPLSVVGATPNPASASWRLVGQLPDGSAVQAQVAVFTRGTFVFQATVVGAHLERLPAGGLQTFFGSLSVAP